MSRLTSRPPGRSRARAAGITVLAVMLLTGACSEIPDSGPVVVVEQSPVEESLQGRYVPAAPTDGDSPANVVDDFLEAMQPIPVGTDVARQYLTRDAAESWDPSQATVVYESAIALEEAPGLVQTELVEVARLDEQGAYYPRDQADERQSVRLRLEKQDGQWRIADLPDALYIDSSYFRTNYSSYSLFFFDLSGETLVPDPVHLPDGEQLGTRLVRSLLQGPTASAFQQLRTALPAPSSLEVAVPVAAEAVAEVRLSGVQAPVPATQAEMLSAQLVWTLRQVPDLRGVRILVDDEPLDAGGAGEVQGLGQWDAYGPSSTSERESLYALQGSRLHTVIDGDLEPVPAAVGERDQDLRSVILDGTVQQLWGVSGDGTRVVSAGTGVGEEGQPVERYRGSDLVPPVITRGGTVLSVDRGDGGSTLVVIDEVDRAPRTLSLGPLGASRVVRFAVAPGGQRFLAVARVEGARLPGPPQLFTGWLRYSADGAEILGVNGVRPVTVASAQLRDIRDAGWVDAATMAVLARADGPQVELIAVSVDGAVLIEGEVPTEPLPELLDPVEIAVAGTADATLYARSADGTLWANDEGGWSQVDTEPVTSPAFAR
ncbi:MAG: LpqB family beta-propeller domain-containing protein [Actinomycetota bacterium]|nr:LpqB family beta-propeller domain-containing protein [Actinomycetota bacterium]